MYKVTERLHHVRRTLHVSVVHHDVPKHLCWVDLLQNTTCLLCLVGVATIRVLHAQYLKIDEFKQRGRMFIFFTTLTVS